MSQKIIKTGIIGFGLSGRVFHAPSLHTNPNFTLYKVVERHREDSKKIYPYLAVVKDWHELLTDPAIDLVVVATPNILHYPMVKECIQAGKHVVVEKPFTVSTAQADELIKLAESCDRKIFVYHNRRWDGDFLTVKKVLKSNILGNLTTYEAHFDRYRPDLIPGAWREEDQRGSGILYDLGSHLIHQALHLFGIPFKIRAIITSKRKGNKVDDCFDLIFTYQGLKLPAKSCGESPTAKENVDFIRSLTPPQATGNALAVQFKAILKADMLVKEEGPRFMIEGERGSFAKYGTDPQEEALKKGIMPDRNGWGKESPEIRGTIIYAYKGLNIEGKIETEAGRYQEFYNNVSAVLAKGHEMAVKPIEARNVIRMIELAFESSKTRSEITVSDMGQ
ncbi:MAG: Gfo/Idh/MocA family oxidoreductase [Syntrophaceae bacterium]|nr:Gfo/Idh/MocA family oxidoreductase [Syntrophaceae bacterium]